MAIAFDTVDHQFLLKKEMQDLQYLYDENNEYLAQLELPNTLFGKNQKLSVANQQVVTPPFASRFSRLMKFSQKPLLKYFYQTPANFIEVHSKYFGIRVNPILNFDFGKTGGDGAQGIFLNRRGLEVRGNVDDRLFFTTNIVETQAGLPGFVDERFARERTLPGVNRVKPYESRVFDVKNGYDFGQSEARIGFHATHHIGIEFGRLSFQCWFQIA